ncbi:MAG: hypothetical protein L6Q71_04730 [Planctomycetes bacterium]|nr:hypothetical protein [Planctomycetota bacterium]NUQ35215.1 hypothetical protein [Planctomycetaceae bacterium]
MRILPVVLLLVFARAACAQHDHAHDDLGSLPLDFSADLLLAAGTSSADDETIESLQGGEHDPRRRGFTLRQLEFAMFGEAKPFDGSEITLGGAGILSVGEEEIHAEEIYLTIGELPHRFTVEAGLSLTEFGGLNPVHPHDWLWNDQAVVITRMFGPEGMAGVGVQVTHELALPWASTIHVGMQEAFSERSPSFGGTFGGHAHDGEEEEAAGVGGRPLIERDRASLKDFAYSLRWLHGFDLNEDVSMAAGASLMFGPNATGYDGRTMLWGADFNLTIFSGDGDERRVAAEWLTEFIVREYDADEFADEGDPLDPVDDIDLDDATLEDWGLYSQLVYHFDPEWAAGVRVDFATSKGRDFHIDDNDFEPADENPLRDDRLRISPLLTWAPVEAIRFRLQCNFDNADHLDENAQSIWLGFEWRFGSRRHQHE